MNKLLHAMLLLAFLFIPASTPAAPATESVPLDPEFGQVPLSFVLNEGQFDPALKFVAEGNNENTYAENMTPITTVLALDQPYRTTTKPLPEESPGVRKATAGNQIPIFIHFYQPNLSPTVAGEDPYPWKSNYFFGNDPAKWKTDLPNYKSVVLTAIYPGIDLRYIAQDRRITHELVVRAGADPAQIKFWHEYVRWNWKFEVTPNGELYAWFFQEGSIRTSTFPAPAAYQVIGGRQVPVTLTYKMLDATAGIFTLEFGAYNPAYEVIIPYEHANSSLIGLRYMQEASGLDVDNEGNVYVAGKASFRNYGGTKTINTGSLFTMKLLPGGKELGYISYFGTSITSSIDYGLNVKVDSNKNMYFAGLRAADFPVTPDVYAPIIKPSLRSFVLKLNSSGNILLYSTLMDGYVRSLDIDAEGNVYIAGKVGQEPITTTPGAYDTKYNPEENQGFVAKLSANGKSIVYSTYILGVYTVWDLVVDTDKQACLTGSTATLSFPITPGAYHKYPGMPNLDVYVLKLNQSGSNLVFSSRFGGKKEDAGYKLVIDNSGVIFLAGSTPSTDFPITPCAFDTTYNGIEGDIYSSDDIFFAILSKEGSSLLYSTYLGGKGIDRCTDIIQFNDKVYMTGNTDSEDFPIPPGNISPNRWFLAEFQKNGELSYSTRMDGNATNIRMADGPSQSFYFCGKVTKSFIPQGLSDDGSIVITRYFINDKLSVNEKNDIPNEFIVLPAYPNPFNPITTILYYLPCTKVVDIKIFDVIGQQTAILKTEYQEKGWHSVIWKANENANGLYFCVIKADRAVKSVKLLLTK
jgi:hypothetical protein